MREAPHGRPQGSILSHRAELGGACTWRHRVTHKELVGERVSSVKTCHRPHLNTAKPGPAEVEMWHPLPGTWVIKPGYYPCPPCSQPLGKHLKQEGFWQSRLREGSQRGPTPISLCTCGGECLLPLGWEQGPSLALATSFGGHEMDGRGHGDSCNSFSALCSAVRTNRN